MQQVLMDVLWEPHNPVGVWYGFFSLLKSHCLFKSMGLMQSYKKGKLIHTVAGVVYPEGSWSWQL